MKEAENDMTRRGFAKLCLGAAISFTGFLAGCAKQLRALPEPACEPSASQEGEEEYDYIVVGSGAGGGPLAANLARKGHRVLLVEAGGGEDNANYRIPLFHPLASEDPEFRWDFFVRHYQDDSLSRKDEKFRPEFDGVFYPRCSTLGGCTAHNAMILVYPHNEDWDYIAELTGDPSWGSEPMRAYFERLENCQYVENTDGNPGRHGFGGWLPTSLPSLETVLGVFRDPQVRDVFLASVLTVLQQNLNKPMDLIKSRFDPNDWRSVRERSEGLCAVPLTTFRGERRGPREYIRQVQQSCPGRLTVKLNTLATKILLEDGPADGKGGKGKRAVGIEYRQGKHLYNADRGPVKAALEGEGRLRARREVILAGGAFNTPQLLMLSGIGPRRHLEEWEIPVQVDLPGVGGNLQDRYEVAVVTEMKNDFSMLNGLDFRVPGPGDPPNAFYDQWLKGQGLLSTNGGVVSFIKKSTPQEPNPDLFVFGMPGFFSGYIPGYSKRVAQDQRHFSWVVLKAHTKNNAGVVKLKSKDPCERPYVNFHYFDEGSDAQGEDLEGLVHGLEFVRSIIRSKGMSEHIAQEVLPGAEVKTREQMREFAKFNAWGHHASCSCRMGPLDDRQTVVDSRFRVRSVENLRIVDASIFPRIPGFFIVSAIYMISEKASDVIHEDSMKKGHPPASINSIDTKNREV